MSSDGKEFRECYAALESQVEFGPHMDNLDGDFKVLLTLTAND